MATRTTKRARSLRRKANDVERTLWTVLRDRRLVGFKFRRQHPIGRYFADIVCLSDRLVIELDGGSMENELPMTARGHDTWNL